MADADELMTSVALALESVVGARLCSERRKSKKNLLDIIYFVSWEGDGGERHGEEKEPSGRRRVGAHSSTFWRRHFTRARSLADGPRAYEDAIDCQGVLQVSATGDFCKSYSSW